MSNSAAQNLQRITESVEKHDSSCKEKAKAVLLNPYEFERLGFDSIAVKGGRRVPIKSDSNLGTGRLRIVCDGYHGPKKAKEKEEAVEAPSPAERELVPAGVPDEGMIKGVHPNCSLGWKVNEPCDPIADIEAMRDQAKRSCGTRPSFLSLSEEIAFYKRVGRSD